MFRTKSILFIIVAFFLILPAGQIGAQQLKAMEFRNQDIKDIFLVLAEANNISIIPDETVEGKASYYFSNMDFEQGLKVFLTTFNLFFVKENGIYYISRVKIDVDKKSSRVSISATEVPLKSLVKILGTATQKTILYDTLPSDTISINIQDTALEDVLKVVITKYADFYLDKKENFFYLKRKSADGLAKSGTGAVGISRSGDLYSLKIEKGRFKELISELFLQARKEFILLIDKDQVIENINLQDKSFEEILRVLLLHIGADSNVKNDVYYILEVQKKDLLRRYLSNIVIPFQYISASEFFKLLPPSLNSGNQLKIDEKGNKAILTGTLEEITPLIDFIKIVDRTSDTGKAQRYDLQYLKSDEFIPLLPNEFAGFTPIPLPGKGSILMSLPAQKIESFKDFMLMVDRPIQGTPIKLKYIKADDLTAKLPPSITEANIVKTNDPSIIFFKGSEQLRRVFFQDLQSIDIPRPQIRYDVFVLQFEEGNNFTHNTEYSGNLSKAGDATAVTGGWGKLFDLNFAVLTEFGYTFGAKLSASLDKNEARVLADTTLNALNGEKVSFQNTNTIRVLDSSGTSTTTTTTTTVREFSSGLIVNLEGWVSGEQMVTMKIDATLSKKTAGEGTNLPGSSEKKISTVVRTPSGKPFVIGGLKQEDVTYTVKKVPLLGDIPILGFLFQSGQETFSKNEFTIYIVPHLEIPEQGEDFKIERLNQFYSVLGKF